MSSKKKAATAQKPATTTKPATVTKPATAAITAETFEPNDPSAGCDYEDVDRTKIAFVEIFPPIGVTRVGDSGTFNGIRKKLRPIEYFYTPEVPNHFDGPEGGFRDKHARIRRQAARFRVYAYDADGEILGEINEKNKYHLEWTVDVANTKAATTIFKGRFEQQTTEYRNPDVQPDLPEQQRSQLIVHPPPVTFAGVHESRTLTGKFQGSLPVEEAIDVTLGEAHTDSNGRLVFIPGCGYSRCVSKRTGYKPDEDYPDQPDITSEFDNIDWIDDVCDGFISVKFSHHDDTSGKKTAARHKAWVISGPPNFAYGINSPTSIWDVVENIYDKASPSFVANPTVQFYRDIWPVLSGTYGISWVSREAFQGHGPNGKGNFLPMEESLKTAKPSDPAVAHQYQQLRQHIFHRLRMPDQLNPDQASTKFMPRLSGDGGDAIEPGTIQTTSTYPNPIEQFAAVTALQYERFKLWKNGVFETKPYPVNKTGGTKVEKIEDVDIKLQPEYLTRAHLETTVGDPVYPGIETYWIVKMASTFDMSVDATLHPPFRITPKLKPGDMTKSLSLPWHSDFGQCNTHWWPSSRPDDVVPQQVYEQLVANNVQPSQLALHLEETTRKPWNRPFRKPAEGDSEFYPNCTDMVRHWQRLGFVVKVPVEGGLPIFIETERTLPADLDEN